MNTVAKKIVLVGHVDGYGGAQTAFKKLYDFVKEEGYQVKTILLTDDLDKSPFAHDSNVLGSISHKGSFFSRHLKKGFGVVRSGIKAGQFKPDIFVCVGLSNSSNILARYFLGKRCFKVGQDFIATREEHDPMWLSSKQVMDGVAVQAPSMLSHWQDVTKGITGINWLPCFPEPPYTHLARKNTSRQPHPIKLCYFGRLADNKGLPLLVKALSVSQFDVDVSIDIWGNGSEENSLRQLAKELHIDDKINFMGSYPHGEEGAKLMVTYDALVLTSTRMEGLPLILIEAMSYGLPFLSTDVGAIRDCCIGNPDVLLVQPEQDDVTEGLRRLVVKIQTNDFDSERLHAFYLTNFSYEVMADRWRTCFESPQDFFYGI